MLNNIPKAYEPHKAEQKWYPKWEESGLFHASADSNDKPYSIVIPPPNVTDVLHLGHALNNTLQDVLIRWRRSISVSGTASTAPSLRSVASACLTLVSKPIFTQCARYDAIPPPGFHINMPKSLTFDTG